MNMKARKLPGKFAPFLTELLKIKSIRLLGLHEIICQIDYRSKIGFHGIFIQSHETNTAFVSTLLSNIDFTKKLRRISRIVKIITYPHHF